MVYAEQRTSSAAQRLKEVFYPGSVAVLGVTDSDRRVGYNMLECLLGGGFKGDVYPVTPSSTP